MSSHEGIRGAGSDRGAAAVELALIMPLFLLLLFGIIEFGRVFNLQISLTGAAREGARVMAIENDWVAAQAQIIATAPSVTSPGPTASRTPLACTPGQNIQVTASREYTFPLLGLPPRQITGIGVMRCGG